ncbi:MAG: hypothetical protein KC713_08275 [Candidatus Omnitrophica bacterium]|nr:hypothetical protein [Candidatus Omnitrophota bacterium]
MKKNAMVVGITCVILACQLHASAQSTYDRYGSGVLEISLVGLKQNAKKLADINEALEIRNLELGQTITVLKQNMNKLDEEHQVLQKQIGQYSGVETEFKSQFQQIQKIKERMIALQEELDLQFQQRKKIEGEIQLNQNKNEEFNGKINEIRLDITAIKKRLFEVDGMLSKMGSGNDIERLTEAIENSKNVLTKVNERYISIKKEYQKPMKHVEELKNEQLTLSTKENFLQEELNGILSQQKELLEVTDQIENSIEHSLSKYQDNINQLNVEKDRLTEVLEQARSKIRDKGLSFADSPVKQDHLTKNLETMQKEQKMLKKELDALKEKMSALK